MVKILFRNNAALRVRPRVRPERIHAMNARHAALILVALAFPFASDVTAQPSGQAVTKKTGYAPVNGLKMYYEISGEGKPAVYIHPIVSHCGLIPGLTPNRQWIGVDLQGHGRTADINRPMTCEQHADDIAALLRHLDVEEADFFGDSFGGTIAVMMAVRHPRLVRRVVAYGGSFAPFPKDIGAVINADSDPVKMAARELQESGPIQTIGRAFAKVLKCGGLEEILARELGRSCSVASRGGRSRPDSCRALRGMVADDSDRATRNHSGCQPFRADVGTRETTADRLSIPRCAHLEGPVCDVQNWLLSRSHQVGTSAWDAKHAKPQFQPQAVSLVWINYRMC